MTNRYFRDVISIAVLSVFLMAACSPKLEDYQPKIIEETRQWKTKIEADIQVTIDEFRKVASSLEAIEGNSSAIRKKINSLIRESLEKNQNFKAVWACWESGKLKSSDKKYRNKPGHDSAGRFMPYWHRDGEATKVNPFINLNHTNQNSLYQKVVRSGREMVSEPFEYMLNGKKELKIGYAVPIKHQDKIVGVAGIDIDLFQFFKPIIRQVRVLDTGYGFLISNSGVLTAHPIKPSNIGKPLDWFGFEPEIIQAVREGREASQLKTSRTTGRTVFYQFVPIQIGAAEHSWSMAINLNPEWLDGSGPKLIW